MKKETVTFAGLLAVFLLVANVYFGLADAQTASAQLIPKPSVPEFTVEYVDRSYYVPPTYGIDPYSGQTVQTGGGFTVNNKTIDLTIKNQHFTPYVIEDGGVLHSIYQSFQIRYKGHFGKDWYNYTHGEDDWTDYTVILFWLAPNTESPNLGELSAGDKVDFQAQARIGYFMHTDGDWYNPNSLVFVGESSDWSSTQTITFGASQTPSPEPTSLASPTQMPDEEPQQLGLEVILFLAVIVAVIAAGLGLLVYLAGRK